jgi:competence ComEA-like helix-hairpin-helix protein
MLKQPDHHQHHRKAGILWFALMILAVSCWYRYHRYGHNIAQPLSLSETETEQLADKINPNDATESSLARLPGIGLTRARNIVTYREKYIRENKEKGPPFTCGEDLSKVKGIGPAICLQVKDYLVFEQLISRPPDD